MRFISLICLLPLPCGLFAQLAGNATVAGNVFSNLPFSVSGTLAGISLGNGSPAFNGYTPFLASDTLRTDITNAPVDPINTAFQATFGSRSLGMDNSQPFNVVDATTQAVNYYPVSTPDGDQVVIPLTGNELIEDQVNGVSLFTCWQGSGTYAGDGHDHHAYIFFRGGQYAGWLMEFYQPGLCNGKIVTASAKLWYLGMSADRQNYYGGDSVSATGLPIAPGLLRYDEAIAGTINHSVRFTLSGTSRLFNVNGSGICGVVKPATHGAACGGDPTTNLVSVMNGSRLRLKSSFNVSSYPSEVQNILNGFKHYGIHEDDNGGSYFTAVLDPRWVQNDVDLFGSILHFSDFEVVTVGSDGVHGVDSNDDANGSDSVVYSFTQTANSTPPPNYNVAFAQVANPYNRPTINSFTASATTVALGSCVTFTLTDTNAQIHYIDNAGPFLGNTLNYCPAQTQTYTAYSRGTYGFAKSSGITVTVTGPTVATPALSPAGGSYGSAQSVVLSDSTSGAAIHYTLDGSTPGCYSPTYSGPIPVSITSTVNSIACASGYLNSAVSSAAYTISGSPAQLQGTYNNNNNGNGGTALTVTVTNSTGGNLNIIAVNLQGSATAIPTSVTSSGGATGTLIKAQNDGAGGGNGPRGFAVYSFPNAPSGTVTYTATWAASTSYAGMTAFVWSAATTSPIESAVGNSGNSGSITCGTVTTTGSNEIIQAIGEVPYGNASSPGYTPISNVTNFQSSYLTVPSATSTVVTQTESTGDFQVCEAFAIRHQ